MREEGTGILDEPVVRHARTDFVAIAAHRTVREALDGIRTAAAAGPFVYFYVVDAEGRLAGVIPTRRLLTSPLDASVDSIMAPNALAISASATVLEACEYFLKHRLLAFPVVDSEHRILGVVDVGLFTEEAVDIEERKELHSAFDTLGVRLSDARDKSLWRGFRSRFPWLLATIGSGTVCAGLAGLFGLTLAKSLILAFFLTLVLGLGESVAMQTMAVTVHRLHHRRSRRGGWYVAMLRRELPRTALLGFACAATVGAIAWAWRREAPAAAVIASGILATLTVACFLGVTIPLLLHRWRLDLRIASGPVTLAVTDVCTITIYFSLAALVLGR